MVTVRAAPTRGDCAAAAAFQSRLLRRRWTAPVKVVGGAVQGDAPAAPATGVAAIAGAAVGGDRARAAKVPVVIQMLPPVPPAEPQMTEAGGAGIDRTVYG